MDPTFVDDYHATQNLDHAIRHGRRAAVPPWAAQMQAEADRAQAKLDARDIANGAYEDVIGPRPATHRKDT